MTSKANLRMVSANYCALDEEACFRRAVLDMGVSDPCPVHPPRHPALRSVRHPVPRSVRLTPGTSGSPLKFMAPGHFCPDVCGVEDFGEADYVRGKVVRAFFFLMQLWPKPKG